MRARARERFGLDPSEPIITFMGRLHAVKRVDLLVEALALVVQGGVPARLLLLGGGAEQAEAGLRELAGRLGVLDRVVMAGWVQGTDKWLALAAGDVLSLQSVHENFGFVAVEALCVGTLPVLTSNLAIAAELSEAGLAVVASPDPQGLAGALVRGLGEQRVQGSAGVLARGPAWVDQNLSPRSIGERMGVVYTRALAGRPLESL